ncbi:MAG: hypothetical protein QG574_3331 [Cyanobacteriota bacterium erpe_2018_sw_21hr_WHONDRS-SW48-000092_B_bin.40]|nr:hypothetical protein [Cyanobacteriota bacterium erpe_2018_sw_21hr_WHONDRS-SW48-000092_B_bin.40]
MSTNAPVSELARFEITSGRTSSIGKCLIGVSSRIVPGLLYWAYCIGLITMAMFDFVGCLMIIDPIRYAFRLV